jgi:glycosyltransferase involved in cell wall biosynthesis
MEKVNDYPKISIITACFNSAKTIEQTIDSVVTQTYPNIEYIIIDGGSTDETVDIIRRYQGKFAYWVSEPDKGIYDAMNKGIDVATGDYIYFLGSDDKLYNYKCIENTVNYINGNSGIDIFFGKVMLVDYNFHLQKECGEAISPDAVLQGAMVPHQGMFVSKSLMKKFLFNTQYKIAADFDFLVKCVLKGCKMQFIDLIIAYYSVNGSSSVDKLRKMEYQKILQSYSLEKAVEILLKSRKKQEFYKALIGLCTRLDIARWIKKKLGWKEMGNN